MKKNRKMRLDGVGASLSVALSVLPMAARAQAEAPAAAVEAEAQATAPESASAAAKPEEGIQEVIVTAQRREQSIMQVPIAISALSSDTLEQAGVTNSSQLAAVVPNLQVNSSFGNTQPNFSLRGISVGNEYNSNQASPIGVYIDDAYMASRTFHGMQLYDLDRVEVLRGPQGTLFGRNTTGGAINFITRSPRLGDSNGYFEGGIGSYNTRRAQGAYEQTFVPDELGARIAFNVEKGDGVYRNDTAGAADPGSTDSLSGRAEVRYKPLDDLDVRLKIYGGRDQPTQAPVHAIGTNPDGSNPVTGYNRKGLPFDTVEQDQVGLYKTRATGGLARIDYHLGDAITLTSISSYDTGAQRLAQDADGAPVDELTIFWNSDFDQYNQELHATYSSGGLDLIGGVYVGQDVTKTANNFHFFYFLDALGVPADPHTMANGGFGIVQQYKQTRDSQAVFAQLDYKFNANWSATLGLRETWDKAQYANGRAYTTDYDGNPGISTIPGPGAYTEDPLPKQSKRDSAPTGRAALTYTFDGGEIVYGSYSRGYRSGTFNGSGYLSPEQIVYVKPEQVNAYELGAKGTFFDHRLTASASAFYYDYTDQQVQEVVGAVALLRNAGNSEVKGFETEFNAYVNHALQVRGSLGLLDATYKDLTLSNTDLSGNSLPFAPKTTAQLGFDWKLAHLDSGVLMLSPNVNYYAKQWFSPFNDDNGNGHLKQDGYWKLDGSLSWMRDAMTVRLWGNNLLGEKYYSYGLDLRQTFGYDFLIPAPGRTYGISVRYDF